MIATKIKKNDERRLKIALTKSLSSSNNELYKIIPRPSEVNFISQITLDFSKKIGKGLNKVFPTSKFIVTSIFCHQSPYVEITSTKEVCELGDLLILFKSIDDGGREYFNSLLLQAKCDLNNSFEIKKTSELTQLKLYNEWPKFKYYRNKLLAGGSIDIQPKTINSGAKYLQIKKDRTLKVDDSYRTAISVNPIETTNSLVNELVEFFKFNGGRTYDLYSSNDEWSMMIIDMIKNAKSKTFKNGKFFSSKDRHNAFSFTVNGDEASHEEYYRSSLFSEIENSVVESSINDKFEGLSIVCIEEISEIIS